MRGMRWVRTTTTAVIVMAGVALGGASAMAATPAALTVITSPDPSVTGSVAYIYSPVTLTGAPRVVVSGQGMRWSGVATFEKSATPGQWWGREPDLALNATALLPVGRTLYAGTGAFHTDGLLRGGHGVLRSTDGGATWQLFSAGLTDQDVLSLAATPDGILLYAGTLRGGLFTLPLK